MLITIEAEIDTDGKITLLEPLKIAKRMRAIITLLDYKKQTKPKKTKTKKTSPTQQKDVLVRQLDWLKSNQKKYGGQYVILDGDKFIGTAKNFPEAHKKAKESGVTNAFITYLSKPGEMGYIGGSK